MDPYIFYPVERYDLQGKELLKNLRKYYISDLGLRRHIVSKRTYELGFSLENAVFLELKRRGFQIYVGKVGSAEIDFVAKKGEELAYYQVCASLTDETNFRREMAPFQSLADNYPKTILTLDRFSAGNYDGIRVVYALDWLMEKN